MSRPIARDAGLDALLTTTIFVGTVVYVSSLPANLSPADEASYLHEAKRLLDGEVMYRDVFDFVTPGFQYLMAFLFGVFGPTITTARVATAVMHGVIGVALYGACRRLGVRPALALTAGLAHLVVDQASWPIASQHWLSTVCCTLLLLAFASGVETPWQAARGGLVLGVLASVQQQRALPMAAGTTLWLVVDALLPRLYGRTVAWSALTVRLAAFAAATAIVVVPVLGYCVVRAGFPVVWSALVEFPLRNYGPTTGCDWGHVNIMTIWQASFTFPRLLTWLPLVLVPTVARLVRLVIAGRDEPTAHRLSWLVTFAASSVLSIQYFPDFIHIAFIAPVFYAVLVENLEAATRWLGERSGGRLATAVAVGVVVAVVPQLAHNWSRLWAEFPFTVDSAFGRVQLRTREEVALYERVRALADASPGTELFVYPSLSGIYLLTGTRNPTRYSWYASTFGFPDILTSLEARRPPYALVVVDWKPDDPIVAYVRREYEPLSPGVPWLNSLLRRRSTG